MGIFRGLPMDAVEPLVETAIAAGLETLELTLNTPDAAGVIKKWYR